MATTSSSFEIVLAVEYGSRESELRADSNQRALESVAEPTHASYAPWGTTLRWDDADTEVIRELTYLQENLADYPLLDDSDYSDHAFLEISAYAHETGLHLEGLRWLADWAGIDRALEVSDMAELTDTLMACYGELPDGM